MWTLYAIGSRVNEKMQLLKSKEIINDNLIDQVIDCDASFDDPPVDTRCRTSSCVYKVMAKKSLLVKKWYCARYIKR